MTPENCENCPETKKLYFQIKDVDLQMKAQKLDIESAQERQNSKDAEHETMIQNLTNRMDTVSQDLQTFKEEVRQDIQNIKKDIPDMFDNAVNKLLAKMFKYVAIGVAIILAVIILAFTKPMMLKGVDNFKQWIERVEIKQ